MATAVYGIFEGGGAKGLGHIAALKAAERNELRFIGVAGASAGALIACLAAVGYQADELFDPANPAANLLSRFGLTPIGLLGERPWAAFIKAQQKAQGTARAALLFGIAGAWLWSRKSVAVARQIKNTGGFFDTARVREELNGFLRTRLMQHHALAGRSIIVPDRVRFRDIDPAIAPECCSLKIIVTDITHGRMLVFGGTPDSADVEVAEAVAASISIPAVFRPAQIPSYAPGGAAFYADGGLVSNLPVWVFAEEKLNYEREFLPLGKVPVLAFSLTDPQQPTETPPQPNNLNFWSAIGRAAIFGGQQVARRFASDLYNIELPTRIGVLDFNFTLRRAVEGYLDASLAAEKVLANEMRRRPAAAAALLRDFLAQITATLATRPYGAAIAQLRVHLIVPAGQASFKVFAGFNSDADADDRLVFSRLSTGAPRAYASRKPAYLEFGTVAKGALPPNMTKYEKALLRQSLSAAICIPVFEDETAWSAPPQHRPEPLGVVSVDSDTSLDQLFNDAAALQDLIKLSLRLNELFPRPGDAHV
jgi:predicted acylesterase/phospholipase RssA